MIVVYPRKIVKRGFDLTGVYRDYSGRISGWSILWLLPANARRAFFIAAADASITVFNCADTIKLQYRLVTTWRVTECLNPRALEHLAISNLLFICRCPVAVIGPG